MRGRAKGWLGLGLEARSGGEAARGVARGAHVARVHGGSVAAGRWQGVTGELTGATGRAPSKVVGGGAHPSGDAAWRRWRMLRAATFNGGEAAPVMDDVDGVALQCQGRREKVRGESIWMERESARS
jgi:hypothetical protein